MNPTDAPHSECWEFIDGDSLQGEYCNMETDPPRLQGTYYTGTGCTGTPTSYDHVADGSCVYISESKSATYRCMYLPQPVSSTPIPSFSWMLDDDWYLRQETTVDWSEAGVEGKPVLAGSTSVVLRDHAMSSEVAGLKLTGDFTLLEETPAPYTHTSSAPMVEAFYTSSDCTGEVAYSTAEVSGSQAGAVNSACRSDPTYAAVWHGMSSTSGLGYVQSYPGADVIGCYGDTVSECDSVLEQVKNGVDYSSLEGRCWLQSSCDWSAANNQQVGSDGEFYGSIGSYAEWGGVFSMSSASHTWIMQKVDGAYADATMKMALIPTASVHMSGLQATESTAATLLAGTCAAIQSGESITPASGGSCFELHTDSAADDSLFTIDTTGLSGLAVWTQHLPIEFERTMHYLRNAHGDDVEPVAYVEPVAEAGSGDGHDHLRRLSASSIGGDAPLSSVSLYQRKQKSAPPPMLALGLNALSASAGMHGRSLSYAQILSYLPGSQVTDHASECSTQLLNCA